MMNWANVLSSVDWATATDAQIDNLLEHIFMLGFRNRYDFLADFELLDKHQRPKSIPEIDIEVIRFGRERGVKFPL